MRGFGTEEESDLIQHIINQLDLIGNLGTTKDRKERTIGVLQRLGEELELFFDKESGGPLRKFYSNHTGMGPVSGSKGIIHIDVTKFREVLAELSNLGGIGFDLLALLILCGPFLLDVEPKVLQENDRTIWGRINRRLDVGANAIPDEHN